MDDLDGWCSQRMSTAMSRMRGLGRDKYRYLSSDIVVYGMLRLQSFLSSKDLGHTIRTKKMFCHISNTQTPPSSRHPTKTP